MMKILLVLLLPLAAAGCNGDLIPVDTDIHTDVHWSEAHVCDQQATDTAVDECWDGCDHAEDIPGPVDLGRLACIRGNPLPTADNFMLPDQGEGPAYQEGYEACYFPRVADAYLDEGCTD